MDLLFSGNSLCNLCFKNKENYISYDSRISIKLGSAPCIAINFAAF